MSGCKLIIVSSSHRKESESSKVAKFLAERIALLGIYTEDQILIHDLGADPLPLWEPGFAYKYAPDIAECEGLVFILPEWHGMATPAMKNWFLYLNMDDIAHKPILLCGVSSGQGGQYSVLDIRSFSFKNHRPMYLPETLLMQGSDALSGFVKQTPGRVRCMQKIDYSLRLLDLYIQSLRELRVNLVGIDRPERYGK